MKKIFITILSIISAIGISTAADYEVVYKTTPQGDLRMTILTPDGAQEGDKLPTVVLFHGGGWNSGSRKSLALQAEYLRCRGLVTVNVEYRIKNIHDTPPIESLRDAKSAIRFIRTNAETYGIDTEKLMTSGGSAGGHLAAAVTMCPKINDQSDDLSISTEVSALLLFNPVVCNGPDEEGAYTGYGYNRVADIYEDFSPIHNVREDVPPTIFMLGSNDNLIPVSVGEEFARLVEARGGRCDLHIYEGGRHSFFNINAKERDATFFVETLKDVDNFIVSLGYLDGEDFVEEWVDSLDGGYTY